MRATEALALCNREIIDEKSQIHYLSDREILEIKKLRRKKPKAITSQTFLGFYQPEVDKKMEFDKSFAMFWMIYPKKIGKEYARKCYKRALKKASFEKMLLAIQKQKTSVEWTKDKGEFIPNPSTWLNQGRWDDELTYKESTAEQHARLKAKGEI